MRPSRPTRLTRVEKPQLPASSRAGSPRLVGFSGPQAGQDARDDGVQPEAEPRGAPPERAEEPRPPVVSAARLKCGGEGAQAVGVSDEGLRGNGPLAALVALCRLRARPPPGPAPQAAGPRRGSLRDRLAARSWALGLLRAGCGCGSRGARAAR